MCASLEHTVCVCLYTSSHQAYLWLPPSTSSKMLLKFHTFKIQNDDKMRKLTSGQPSMPLSNKNWPVHMFECINDDWSKVLGELWSFPLAVLDDVIGQIQEGQLARYLSCTCLKKKQRNTHTIWLWFTKRYNTTMPINGQAHFNH